MTEKRTTILMTHSLPEDWIGELLTEFWVVQGDDAQRGIDPSLKSHLSDAEGILCLLDDPILEDTLVNAPKLKVVSNMAVGVDNIDVETCTRLNIRVGHTPGVLTEGTADLTLALLLAVARQIPGSNRDAREGRWASWNPTGWLGADLKDATVGIVGLGKIGTAVAWRIKSFGANLIFTNRSLQPEKEQMLSARQVSLDELLQESDFICLHVPLTDETEHMIDEQAFKKMKSTAILINAARGKVIHTDSLVSALQEDQIRAAGLDVTDPEPLPPNHPLFDLKNCLITPHIGSATFNTRKTMARIAIQNLKAGIRGEPLPHCANPLN
jgi:phosphoglycerate dehydrogenase-like enzyme